METTTKKDPAKQATRQLFALDGGLYLAIDFVERLKGDESKTVQVRLDDLLALRSHLIGCLATVRRARRRVEKAIKPPTPKPDAV